MDEDFEKNDDFPINVSEVVKLIQERITKKIYKFTYEDNEESPDQDFYLRFNCMQGWYIRCSYATKVGFLKKCAMQVNDLNLLIAIINTLYTISSKDRLYSLTRGNFQAADMKLLPDDNRCLHKETLEKVINNEIIWFQTLSNNKQYIFLTKLINLADGLVVMNNIFAHFIDVLKIRARNSKLLKPNLKLSKSKPKTSSVLAEQIDEGLREAIRSCFHKIVPRKKTENISNNELNSLLYKWQQFISRYSEQISSQSKKSIEKDNLDIKAHKSDSTIDIIQRHPTWVTMSILDHLDNPNPMSKVNEYWAATLKEFKGEVAARKLLNKDIAALEDQINTINFSKKLSYQQPELRDKVNIITKPYMRNKFRTQENATHYSLISEVYKDYLVDFNLYSKKLQSFPRAINVNKLKTCNI